jgi:hypothetical protein
VCSSDLFNFHNICSFYFENINNSKPLFSNKTFIKSLILSARKFPFIFISEIERKFNIIFNHIFKYKISISIENFYTENNNNFIEFNEPKISTFLNGDDIFYYLFAQNLNNINITNNDNIKEENNNNINNSIDNISMINRSIIPKDNYNYNILNSSRDAAIINNNNNNNLFKCCKLSLYFDIEICEIEKNIYYYLFKFKNGNKKQRENFIKTFFL